MSLPKLMLLHGALGAPSQFDALRSALENHFEIFTPAFSGHGGKEIPQKEFSFKLFTADLVSFLDHHHLTGIDIFGYSMGGYAALHLAQTHPGRVRRLFCLATKMDWNEITSYKEAAMLNPEKMEEKIPAYANMLAQRHAPQDWKSIVRKTAGMMLALGRDHLTEKDFRTIPHQTCIAVGELDNMVSQEESKHAASALQHATFKMFPGMPHPFEKADVKLLAAEIVNYFK